ncbi:hypothetical protein Q9L58_008323 [Maublancomyces gigas]|uniref:Uncharacterized protein n=1 Tax=Discina gigas TaxID=1032678 RepID=A0ABR3G9Y9_9PEZI
MAISIVQNEQRKHLPYVVSRPDSGGAVDDLEDSDGNVLLHRPFIKRLRSKTPATSEISTGTFGRPAKKGTGNLVTNTPNMILSSPNTIPPVFEAPSSPNIDSSPPERWTSMDPSCQELSPPVSSLNYISEEFTYDLPENCHDRIPESQYTIDPQLKNDGVPETQLADTSKRPSLDPVIAVFIKSHTPFYVPHSAGYQMFEAAVSQRLKWGGSQADREWVVVGLAKDWQKLVKKYGEVGVFVRVVEDSWFNSDGEDLNDDIGDQEANEFGFMVRDSDLSILPYLTKTKVPATAPSLGRKNKPISPVLNTPQPRMPKGSQSTATKLQGQAKPTRPKPTKQETLIDESQLPNTGKPPNIVTEKRRPGRPRKSPLPVLVTRAIEDATLKTGPVSTTTDKSRRVPRKSEKASQELGIRAEKQTANQVALARRRLKILPEEFII